MKIRYLCALLPTASLLLLGATGAWGQTTASDTANTDEVKVERTSDELKADVRDAVARDIDTTDTVLVFNAPGPGYAVVYCRGYDMNGRLLGRTATKVPHRGLRYVRASDLANGHDFVGSAFCQTRGNVLASSIFLAPGAISNLNVDQAHVAGMTRIQFPVVASY